MKFTLRGASSAAILVGLAGTFPAWAQDVQTVTQPPAEEETDTGRDRVVVTGSFIQGTPEDAALPVEVFSQEDLEKQGAPTALEFVKSLTIAGPTTGEAYYFGGAALTGSVNFNLRGIGADKTLTLLNGRRMSQNTSNMPSAAIARIEILKDGAATIYGADAVGGVVNFITRDDFVGLEVGAQYKYIDGSDGDYGLNIIGGFGNDSVNFMWAAEWEHRSRLSTVDREWTQQPYSVNSAPWSTLTNLGGYIARTAPTAPDNTVNGELGTPVGGPFSDFTPQSCADVGGTYINTYTCAYNYISYYNLVEDNDIYRLYAQLNADIDDHTSFHFDASYGQVITPKVFGSPAQPVTRGPARSAGLTYQFYVPRTNPYFMEFANRSGLATAITTLPGGVQVPTLSLTDSITPITYRAMAHGGNPYLGEGDGFGVPSKIDNQVWRVSAGLNGDLGEWAGPFMGIGYDFGVTYNHQALYQTNPDILGYRLQEAINGFGGPNCSVPDLDPLRFGTQNPALAGTGGCEWWNPFASSFANQPVLGLSNPSYVAGSENSEALTRWLFDDRAIETNTNSLTIDLVFNGETGVDLPGGTVGWAAGTQWRQTEEREVVFGDYYNGNTPCDWPEGFTTSVGGVPTAQIPVSANDPRYTGCSEFAPGPFVFFDTNRPDYSDQQQFSYFGELSVPVLDNLNFQLAARREEFSGDLSSTVYKVSGKWDVWGPLSLRGSYGTNFQAPPLGLTPGRVIAVNRSYTIASSNWRGGTQITQDNISPAEATAWNLGAIWQSEGFAPDHDFRIILDYFDIETENEIGEVASHNQIANAIFSGFGVGAGNYALANCSHPLISRVTFNDTAQSPGGVCTQGSTTSDNFSSIATDLGNGPGQMTNGIDLQVSYMLPMGPGDLSIDLTATRVLELKTGPAVLDGFSVTNGDDRLGTLNFATVAAAAPEWRANLFVNYGLDVHNFRLGLGYVSAVTDERAGTQYGENGEDWLSTDFFYTFDVTPDLRLSASIVNLFDKDPPPAQEELGYDPRLGSPLGRTFEIGIKKTF